MSNKKKSFGFDGLLSGEGDKKSLETRSNDLHRKSINTIKEVRVTIIINEEYIDKIKSIAFMERKLIKDVWNQAISKHIEDYERENGQILVPKK